MSESLETKKKGGSVLKVILVIILLALFTVGGWFGNEYYQKHITKTEKSSSEKALSNDEKESWKDLGTDISKVEDVHGVVKIYTQEKSRLDGGKSFYSSELLQIALSKLSAEDIVKTDEKLEANALGYSPSIFTISKKTIENKIKPYFNDNYKIDYDALLKQSLPYQIPYDISTGEGSGMTLISHDDNNIKFTLSGIGGSTGPQAKVDDRKIESVSENGDLIKVVEKKIYAIPSYVQKSDGQYIEYFIYSDPLKKIYIGNLSARDNEIGSKTISVDDYKEYASTITSIYKKDKETGKYYFLSSELKETVK